MMMRRHQSQPPQNRGPQNNRPNQNPLPRPQSNDGGSSRLARTEPDHLDSLMNKMGGLDFGAQASQLNTSRYTSSRQNLRIIPMGGVEEVGENMTAIEYGDDIIIIDMGLAFPDDTMPGIDYIIPDTKWLEENK